MTKDWASVQAAIDAGNKSDIYPRLDAGIANMRQYIPVLNKYRGYIPLSFLMVKGAWESKGTAHAQSASLKDVGLFQLLLDKPKGSKMGYSFEQLKDPAINTRVYTDIVTGNADSFLKTHRAWFPEGTGDWQFWGIQWLSSGIGPHATRHLLDAVGSGGRAFDRVVSWVANHPEWMEAPAQLTGFSGKSHWGVQSGELVAFRTMLAKRIMVYMRNLDRTLPQVSQVTAAAAFGGAGARWPVVLAALSLAGVIAGTAILYLEKRRRESAFMGYGSGTPGYRARMVLTDDFNQFKKALQHADKCGSTREFCTLSTDPWGKQWESCTWRMDDQVVAAFIGQPHWYNRPRSVVWVDRSLLRGRCPKV